jgi:uncharacterized membrane protein
MSSQGINSTHAHINSDSQQTTVPEKNQSMEKINDVSHVVNRNTFWNQHVRPLYQYRINAMKMTDVLIIGGGAVTAFCIAFFGRKKLNMSVLAVASAYTLLGAGAITTYRINKHYNEVAWNFIDQIHTHVAEAKKGEFNLTKIHECYNKMKNKPEFCHLNNDLQTLENKIEEFQKICQQKKLSDSNFTRGQNNFQRYLTYLLQKTCPNKRSNLTDIDHLPIQNNPPNKLLESSKTLSTDEIKSEEK